MSELKGLNHEMEQDTVNGTDIRTIGARCGGRKNPFVKQMALAFTPLGIVLIST
jgi:hypothetical protein